MDHASPEPQVLHSGVAGPEDLERLLDQLSSEAAAQPFMAELVTAAGARLGIGLGSTSGSVLSFKECDDPPYFVSVGRSELVSDDDVGFYFQGRWSEFPSSALVPVGLAREAAHEFLSTGQRPDAVNWDEV